MSKPKASYRPCPEVKVGWENRTSYFLTSAHGLKDTAHHGEEDIAPGASQEVRACCWQ